MKYFSMFTGIGGFELGIGEEHECVGFSEIDKWAISVYKSHFPDHINYGDATKIDPASLPAFDLLCGGFPCQAFSIAGKRKGFDDARGTLFYDIARIAAYKKPTHLLLENVKGLLSHDGGRTFATIILTLDELGYDTEWQVCNSLNFGSFQNRERVFIIGHLRGRSTPGVFPVRPTDRGEDKKQVQEQRGGCLRPIWKVSYSEGTRRAILHSRRLRFFTNVEFARIQGFPDYWLKDVSRGIAHKLAGNAVNVNVVKEIIKRLLCPNP